MPPTAPTIEDILKYEEVLEKAVDKQIEVEQNPKAKSVLLRMQVLLKSRAIRKFVDNLRARKLSWPLLNKIREIDEALDELRLIQMNLPYPEMRFLLDQSKKEKAQKYVVLALLLGLFGIEWVN